MVDREGNGILRRLVSNWDHLKAELERLHSTAEVRPADGYMLFRQVEAASPDLASFVLSPVVFNLPERADDTSTDLFVVVEGRISFERETFSKRGTLATHDFGTKVAYFRRSLRSLDHVFGGHYDFSRSELGHPVFHGQLRSYPGLAESVKAYYSIDQAVIINDCVKGLLRTVRVPTAQMDVFSLFVQLCADHLLYINSGPEEKAAFNSLLRGSAFCQGAAFQVPRLETEEACTCYRARHWYDAIA
jgi:hypothetical protein